MGPYDLSLGRLDILDVLDLGALNRLLRCPASRDFLCVISIAIDISAGFHVHARLRTVNTYLFGIVTVQFVTYYGRSNALSSSVSCYSSPARLDFKDPLWIR